jgi:hypothetical protein
MGLIVQKIKNSCIVGLLLATYEEIKKNQNQENKSDTKKLPSALFKALIGYASVKYMV